MDKNLNIFQSSEVDLKVNGGPTNIGAFLGTYDKVVLKPNKKGSKNVLEQWMVSTPHTKYVVKYDFNLQDTIIEMPDDSILEIDCGSLQHGTLVGRDTILLNTNDVDNALVDITLDGTWVSGRVAPDEEDITQEKGLLKFANKAYEPNKFSGLGRVYLRKNINPAPVAEDIWMFRKGADDIVYLMYRYQGVVYHIYDEDTGKGVILENNLVKESDDYNIVMLPAAAQEHNMPYVKEGDRIIITLPNGGRINDVQLNQTEMYYYTDVEPGGEGNILTQDMINKPNTIYIIQYDYDLNGKTITIPANCVFEFDGGSISNGTITYSNTKVINANYHNVTITGVCSNENTTPYDYGYNSDNTPNVNGIALNNAFANVDKLYLNNETFEYSGYLVIQDCFIVGDNGLLKLVVEHTEKIDAISFRGTVKLTDVNIDLDHKDCWGISSAIDSNLTIIRGSIKNVGIEDETIANYNRGALLLRGDAYIDGLYVENCTAYGICIYAEGKQPTFENGALKYAESLAYGLNVTIVNCSVKNVGYHGIGNTIYHIFKSLIINNCYAEYCGNKKNNTGWHRGGSGIGATNCANFIITNCHANYNWEHGLVLQDCFNGTLANNISQYNGSCGLRIQANYQKINNVWIQETDNMFYGMSGCENVNVLNNYLSNNNIHGIFIGQHIRKVYINYNSIFNNVNCPINIQGHSGDNPPVDKYSDPEDISIENNMITSNLSTAGYNNVIANDSELKNIKVKNIINGKTNSVVVGINSDLKYLINADKKVPLDFYKTNFAFSSAAAANTRVYFSKVKLNSTGILTNDDVIVVSLKFKSFPVDNVYRCIISLIDENDNSLTNFQLSHNQINYRSTKYREDGIISIVHPCSLATLEQCQATRYLVLEILSIAAYTDTPELDFAYFGIGECDQTDVQCKKNILTNIVNTNITKGTQYFDNNKYLTYTGSKFVEYDGATAEVKRSGTFAEKPSASDIYIGFSYFCTDKQTTEGATNGIEIIYKGSNVWVDALGRVIS